MTNVYIDNLSAAEAQALFNAFAEKDYLSSSECNLNGHSSSVRLECYNRYNFFCDLAGFFQ
jgi:hypothetical protein